MNEFDKLGPWYAGFEYAAFGSSLWQSRLAHLSRIEHHQRILIVGEGDGRFLGKLLSVVPTCAVDVLESSARMIELAQHRLNRQPTIHIRKAHFIHTDVRFWNGYEEKYDLIVTHYLLDCFAGETLTQVIHNLSNAVDPNGAWLWTDFVEQKDGWRRWRSRLWLWAMYRFFRQATNLSANHLVDALPLIRAEGFQPVADTFFQHGMIRSTYLIRSA